MEISTAAVVRSSVDNPTVGSSVESMVVASTPADVCIEVAKVSSLSNNVLAVDACCEVEVSTKSGVVACDDVSAIDVVMISVDV